MNISIRPTLIAIRPTLIVLVVGLLGVVDQFGNIVVFCCALASVRFRATRTLSGAIGHAVDVGQ